MTAKNSTEMPDDEVRKKFLEIHRKMVIEACQAADRASKEIAELNREVKRRPKGQSR